MELCQGFREPLGYMMDLEAFCGKIVVGVLDITHLKLSGPVVACVVQYLDIYIRILITQSIVDPSHFQTEWIKPIIAIYIMQYVFKHIIGIEIVILRPCSHNTPCLDKCMDVFCSVFGIAFILLHPRNGA